MSVYTILPSCLVLFYVMPILNYTYAFNLSEKLHRFEKLHLKDVTVERNVSNTQHCTVIFSALGRKFVLLLRPHPQLFHSFAKVHMHSTGGQVEYFSVPRREFYEGVVRNEQESTVYAHINDRGILTASVVIQNEQYRIEPSRIHDHESHDYHMIIYKMSDHRNLTSLHHFCKESTQPQVQVQQGGHRVLRQTQSTQLVDGFGCSLHLIADYKFYRHIGGSDRGTTVAYMVNVLLDVDAIYRRTTWESSSGKRFNNIGLQIANVTIYRNPTSNPSYNKEVDINTGIDSQSLLQELSYNDWTNYCLVHLFTFQLLSGKTLGVAYTASADEDAIGGICSKGAFIKGTYASTNVGFSSFRDRNTGSPLLRIEGEVIVAHEIGHSFGSKHDPLSGGPCDPPRGANQGKYLMYPAAVDGTERNNEAFSPCSRLSIGNTLESRGHLCFTRTSLEYCGNWFIEDDEECDGGPGGDQCCDNQCKLKPGAKCSDTNDLCCRMCDFANSSVKCAERSVALVCKSPSYCTGSSKICPPQEPLVGEPCPAMGICTLENRSNGENVSRCLPFCSTMGLEPCQCPNDECKLCCRPVGGMTCTPHSPTTLLNDGVLCTGGYCSNGECEIAFTDLSSRLRRIFTSPDEVALFVKENLVGCIIILSAAVWIIGLMLVKFVLIPLWHKKLHSVHGVEFRGCCGIKSRVEMSESTDPKTPMARTPLKRSWSSRSGRTDHFYGRSTSYRQAQRSPLIRLTSYSPIYEEEEAEISS